MELWPLVAAIPKTNEPFRKLKLMESLSELVGFMRKVWRVKQILDQRE